MDYEKKAKRYFNKYFKQQYIDKNDDEYKALVRLLYNANKKKPSQCSRPPYVKGSFMTEMF